MEKHAGHLVTMVIVSLVVGASHHSGAVEQALMTLLMQPRHAANILV